MKYIVMFINLYNSDITMYMLNINSFINAWCSNLNVEIYIIIYIYIYIYM